MYRGVGFRNEKKEKRERERREMEGKKNKRMHFATKLVASKQSEKREIKT
jgi:hypothetical protein